MLSILVWIPEGKKSKSQLICDKKGQQSPPRGKVLAEWIYPIDNIKTPISDFSYP